MCCACLERQARAWEFLFAARANRTDSLLVDALRARAVRLFPRDAEKQEDLQALLRDVEAWYRSAEPRPGADVYARCTCCRHGELQVIATVGAPTGSLCDAMWAEGMRKPAEQPSREGRDTDEPF